jgi:Zn-dependent protease with chaperone function
MRCRKCGYENLNWEDFCSNCRANLSPKLPYLLKAEEFVYPQDKEALDNLKETEPLSSIINLVVDFIQQPMMRAKLLAGGTRVNLRNNPRVHNLTTACAKVLALDYLPEICILESPKMNAFTIGRRDKPIVILFSTLVEHSSDGELAAVLGHEMGHVKNEHQPYHTLAYLVSRGITMLGSLSMLSIPIDLILRSWYRYSEITADRASLIVTGDLDLVERVQVKLALGIRDLPEDVSIREILDEQKKLEDTAVSKFAQLWTLHPFTGKRIQQIEEFAETKEYAKIAEKIRNAKVHHCRFCAARIPEDTLFCPECSRCQR